MSAVTDLVKALRILGVSPNDDAETIRKAWRALLRSYRPDIARRDPLTASKKLADINLAFKAVCACGSGDLEKLRSELKERARREDSDRRDALMLRRRAQRKREELKAAVRKMAGTCPTASSDVDQTQLGNSAPANIDVASLVERAERGFGEALGICSLLNFANARSSYL